MRGLQHKIRSVALLFAAVLLLLVSCSSARSAVVGRWEITIEDETLGKVDMVYHFKENGEICLEQENDDEIPFSIPFGTFVVEGENLTIYSDGEESVYTFSVSEEALMLYSAEEEALCFRRI